MDKLVISFTTKFLYNEHGKIIKPFAFHGRIVKQVPPSPTITKAAEAVGECAQVLLAI